MALSCRVLRSIRCKHETGVKSRHAAWTTSNGRDATPNTMTTAWLPCRPLENWTLRVSLPLHGRCAGDCPGDLGYGLDHPNRPLSDGSSRRQGGTSLKQADPQADPTEATPAVWRPCAHWRIRARRKRGSRKTITNLKFLWHLQRHNRVRNWLSPHIGELGRGGVAHLDVQKRKHCRPRARP